MDKRLEEGIAPGEENSSGTEPPVREEIVSEAPSTAADAEQVAAGEADGRRAADVAVQTSDPLVAKLVEATVKGVVSVPAWEGGAGEEDRLVQVELHDGRPGMVPTVLLDDPPQEGEAPEGERGDRTGEPPIGAKVMVHARKASQLHNWQQCMEAWRNGQPLKGRVAATTKGGLVVTVGCKAFMPASHADIHPVSDLSSLVGQEFPVVIIRVEKRRMGLVVSRRLVLEEERREELQSVLQLIKTGDRVVGRVTSLMSYGAMVRISPSGHPEEEAPEEGGQAGDGGNAGVDALLHVSDTSWGKPRPVAEQFEVGQELEVVVLRISSETGKVNVGVRQLTPDPWESVGERIRLGDELEGVVTGGTDYGVFVELEPGVEGMIHISELDWTEPSSGSLAEAYPPGTTGKFKVVEFSPERRRIGLSRKALLPDPWVELVGELPAGTIMTRPVAGVAEFGVFVSLTDSIRGLVHRGEISWQSPPEDLAAAYPVGTLVEVMVLDVDGDKRRASLSMKRAQKNPWEGLEDRISVGNQVSGKVTRVAPFGAFVEVEPGVEGLVHISRLSDDRVEAVDKVVSPGQSVDCTVVGLDMERSRLSLSMESDPRLHAEGADDGASEEAQGGGRERRGGDGGRRGRGEPRQQRQDAAPQWQGDAGKAGTSLGELPRERFGAQLPASGEEGEQVD